MGSTKISGLPAVGPLDGTEFLPVVQGGTTKRVSLSAIATYLAGQATAPVTSVTAHRYWRLNNLQSGNSDGPLLPELRVYDAAGNQLAYTATASSELAAGYGVPQLNDNQLDSTWGRASGDTAPWIALDFTTPVLPARIGIFGATNDDWLNQQVQSFVLQYGDNGTSWTDAVSMTFADYQHGVEQKVATGLTS